MFRTSYKLLKLIVPRRLKGLVVNKISAISRQVQIEDWGASAMIPLDQKMARLEARIVKLESLLAEKNLLDEWVEKSLVPFEQKLERLNAQAATKDMLLDAKSQFEQMIDHVSSEKKLLQVQTSLLHLKNRVDTMMRTGNESGMVFSPLCLLAEDSNEFLSDEEYFRFEKQFHQSFDATDKQYKETLLSYTNPGDRIVEIGCGTGRLLRFLLDNQPKISVLGIDNSRAMVQQSVEEGVDAICGDALEVMLHQEAGVADLIFAIHIVEHLPLNYLRNLLNDCYRVLRDGGRLIIETPNTQSLYVMSHYYFADPTHQMPRHPSLLAYVLRGVGFSAVKVNFSGQPPDELIMSRSSSGDTIHAAELDQNAVRFNQLFFSAGNNVIIEAVK